MHRLLRNLADRPRLVVIAWAILLIAAAPFALQLRSVARGSSEAIRGSESHGVMVALEEAFGRGAAHVVPVVLSATDRRFEDPEFAAVAIALAEKLSGGAADPVVTHPWNSGLPELRGRDGHSVLLLVRADASTLVEAEDFTFVLREKIAAAGLPPGFRAEVTGIAALFADLNRQSSADLLRAEAIGIPLTLLVLLVVFRSPLAAGLALAVAGAAVTVTSALLCLVDAWIPVGVFAQNVVSMIGLGAGTDYALFLLSHQRDERARGVSAHAAVLAALRRTAPAITVSGLAVAGGFGALLVVNARFLHSLALGGIAVVLIALAATLTLLPALMRIAGERLNRPRPARVDTAPLWQDWARIVMGRPGLFLLLALALTAACAWPARRSATWNFGPRDLPAGTEARTGYERLATDFAPGWMGPVVLTLESPRSLWEPAARAAIVEIDQSLAADPRVAHVLGFPRLPADLPAATPPAALPPPLAAALRSSISEDGRLATVIVVPRHAAEAVESLRLVTELRERNWPAAAAAGIEVRVGGATAMVQDFDAEMLGSFGRVVLVVMTLTALLLFVFFRSIAVPLKAIAANLLSVIAAYGFLVLVFQDGHGAGLLGLTPPGGLNSFVVLMLFTILFGLSMDYEIFLLSEIRTHHRAGAGNTEAVAAGLASTAGVITSAAAVMVCLFGSFSFFGLVATREFGLGLAFAVAFDATVIRLLIVPAAMRLLGEWNWWPASRGRVRRVAGDSGRNDLGVVRNDIGAAGQIAERTSNT